MQNACCMLADHCNGRPTCWEDHMCHTCLFVLQPIAPWILYFTSVTLSTPIVPQTCGNVALSLPLSSRVLRHSHICQNLFKISGVFCQHQLFLFNSGTKGKQRLLCEIFKKGIKYCTRFSRSKASVLWKPIWFIVLIQCIFLPIQYLQIFFSLQHTVQVHFHFIWCHIISYIFPNHRPIKLL